MNILLSIHHKYAQEIMNGTKKFEYRKMKFSHPVDLVYLYESSPIKLITGCFKLSKIIRQDPSTAWKLTHNVSGISKRAFFKYYSHTKKATLLKIGTVRRFSKPMTLSNFGIKYAPMSFNYL